MGRKKVNSAITKSEIVNSVRKNLDISFAADDAYQFLVDVINNAKTLKTLNYLVKDVPSGKIDTLKVKKRKIRLADDDSNDNPKGVNSVEKGKIEYAVKKVFWDEWIRNDDVLYNAIRQAHSQLLNQEGISSTSDLESLIIQMIQKQFAMDLQDLAFNGDTAYPISGEDSCFLRILDGFVKKMMNSKNITDLSDKPVTLADFLNHVQLLPEEYTSNFEEDYVWIMSRKTHDKIMSLVQSRATGYGDAVLQDGKVKRLAGYNIEIVAGLQGPLKDTSDTSKGRKGFVALTPRSNLVPVMTSNIKYKRTAEGALALKKDSSYHIIHAYLDCIIRDENAVAYMVGDKL